MIRQTGRLAAGAVRSFLNTGLMVVSKEILGSPSSAQGRVAVVASRYNESITNRLVEGAIETLKSNGFSDDQIDLARVPGAWELPLIAQRFAESQSYIAVVCLGAVIKGETTHDEYINHQVAQSLGQIALDNDIPVAAIESSKGKQVKRFLLGIKR